MKVKGATSSGKQGYRKDSAFPGEARTLWKGGNSQETKRGVSGHLAVCEEATALHRRAPTSLPSSDRNLDIYLKAEHLNKSTKAP